MKNILSAISWFAIPVLLCSCGHYYKAIQAPIATPVEKAASIQKLSADKRTLILRNGTDAFLMNNVVIKAEEKLLECTLDDLPDIHRLHLTRGRDGKMKYLAGGKEPGDIDDKAVLTEAHLYLLPLSSVAKGFQTILLNNITQIEIIEPDAKKAKRKKFWAITISAVCLAFIAFVIGGASLEDWDINGR